MAARLLALRVDPKHFTSGGFQVHIFVRERVGLMAIVWLEGSGKLKNMLTSSRNRIRDLLPCNIVPEIHYYFVWRKLSPCLTKHYDMKTYEEVVVFLTLALAGCEWSLPLCPRRRSHRYPSDRRLGGPQSRSGRYGELSLLDPTGTRTPTPRSSSP
jgi:hypothetical protein